MTYKLLLDSNALNQFGQLPADDYKRVRDAITALAKEPKPLGSLQLVGRSGWHYRVGKYRVMYNIDDEQQAVTIVYIGRARDSYR
ncbi:MAG: type II toxin-antitoxin system RelE family toxin [Blastocatellia bacterium]